MNLRDPLVSGRTFGREPDGVWTVWPGKEDESYPPPGQGRHPFPHLWNSCSAPPCCNLRQGRGTWVGNLCLCHCVWQHRKLGHMALSEPGWMPHAAGGCQSGMIYIIFYPLLLGVAGEGVPVSQAELRHWRERKCPPHPSYKLWTPPQTPVCLNHPDQDLDIPHRAQFHGERESHSEQRHSRCKTQGRSSF